MRKCTEVTICNSHFVHDESRGLGLYLRVVHGIRHVVGHRVTHEVDGDQDEADLI